MDFLVTFVTKLVMFIMKIDMIITGKDDDERQLEIMQTVEDSIIGIFGR